MRQAGYASMDRMPPVPETGALPADPPRVNDYDVLAEAYTAENEASLINAYYARPAILALAGDVAGGGSSTPAAAPARCSRRCATGAPS